MSKYKIVLPRLKSLAPVDQLCTCDSLTPNPIIYENRGLFLSLLETYHARGMSRTLRALMLDSCYLVFRLQERPCAPWFAWLFTWSPEAMPRGVDGGVPLPYLPQFSLRNWTPHP